MKVNKWTLALKLELLVVLLLCVMLYIIYLLFMEGYVRFNYPSDEKYRVRGIDVSNHQGIVQWERLDSVDVQFAFIKATEGADFKDKSFERNWNSARKNNIVVSAYHFFTFCRSGAEQARNFIETVPNEPDMLPPAIDLEYSGNCRLTKSKEELLADIDIYIKTLESVYKRRVIIYVTEKFYNDFLIGLYPDNPLWVRDIFKEAHVKDDRQWVFWQYADKGRLEGVNTLVDLNVFHAGPDDFTAFVSRRLFESDLRSPATPGF